MDRRCGLLALALLAAAGWNPDARGATCYAVTDDNQLLTFQTGSPSAVEKSVPLGNISPGESVEGIDLRPADGKLYLLTLEMPDTARLYTVEPSTGAATLVGALSQKLSGSFFGMDFDPVADRLRVVSDTGQNLRVNPVSAEVAIDASLAYAAGDPSAGQFPAVFSCAYTNNFAGAGGTLLYGIDTGTDALVLQDPAGGGMLRTVGGVGQDFGGSTVFDIAPSPVNHAYAALPSGSSSSLYLIDLATGHASLIGEVGANVLLRGFTVAPGYPQTAFARQQNIHIVANGVGYQELSYNYTTGQISVTPYSSTNGGAARQFPFVEWTGVFHYDYGAGAFTHAVYSRQHPL